MRADGSADTAANGSWGIRTTELTSATGIPGRECSAKAGGHQQIALTNIGIVGQERQVEAVKLSGTDCNRPQAIAIDQHRQRVVRIADQYALRRQHACFDDLTRRRRPRRSAPGHQIRRRVYPCPQPIHGETGFELTDMISAMRTWSRTRVVASSMARSREFSASSAA